MSHILFLGRKIVAFRTFHNLSVGFPSFDLFVKEKSERDPCAPERKPERPPCVIMGPSDPPPPAGPTKAPTIGPVRLEPAVVRLGFLPNEWYEFFYPKTGVSGFGTFLFTTCTYIISKEYFVMGHEYYNGLSVGLFCIIGAKYVGPMCAAWLDRKNDEYEKELNDGKAAIVKSIESGIEGEKWQQVAAEGQLVLVAAKRENVQLQVEGAFRRRQMMVYNEVKNRLDYHAEVSDFMNRMRHKNMIKWVMDKVKASITPEIECEVLSKSFSDIAMIALRHKNGEGGGPDDDDSGPPCTPPSPPPSDPCARKEVDPCAEKDPCKKASETKDPCTDPDPCKKHIEKKDSKQDSFKKKLKDICLQPAKRDTCKEVVEPKEDPWKRLKEICFQPDDFKDSPAKKDPCKELVEMKEDPCKRLKDICFQPDDFKESSAKKDPCKETKDSKQEDPCKRLKEISFQPDDFKESPAKKDPCKETKDSKQEDPCKRLKEICFQPDDFKDPPAKKDPDPPKAAKTADPCEQSKQKDPCKTEPKPEPTCTKIEYRPKKPDRFKDLEKCEDGKPFPIFPPNFPKPK